MDPVNANADKLGVDDDTRRATFKTYVFCNCELKRLIRWSREKIGRAAPKYTGMSLERTTAADLQWINELLKLQDFLPVP